MNVLVIGLGSMGKRRIRLLQQYVRQEGLSDHDWKIIGLDFKEERRTEAQQLFGIETYASFEKAAKEHAIDCAVISTSPLSHASIINQCLTRSLHVFTELNLTDQGYEENVALAKKQGKVLFLSSTFLYRREIRYIKENAKDRMQGMTYRYHIGQYLPEWHPWESYKEFFAGQKMTNGCREIFAIELPWLLDVFGEVEAVEAVHGKLSGLDIDFDDTYQVLLKHKSGVMGTLAVDVVTPRAGREFELWGEGFYLEWRGTPDSLNIYHKDIKQLKQVQLYEHVEHMEGYDRFVVENAYYEELADYIDTVRGQKTPGYTFEKDREILALIDRIEE